MNLTEIPTGVRQTPPRSFEAQRGKTTHVHSGGAEAATKPPPSSSSMPERDPHAVTNQPTCVASRRRPSIRLFFAHTHSDAECRKVDDCKAGPGGEYTSWITSAWKGREGQPVIDNRVARWQNLIPSFPWIAPGWRAWGRNAQSKERKGSNFAV